LEQGNIVSSVNFDLDEDWWRVTYEGTTTYCPNGYTAQKFIEVFICPSSPIPERIENKIDGAAGDKIGACGDYFPPEGVSVNINLELPTAFQLGFNGATFLPGCLQPLEDSQPNAPTGTHPLAAYPFAYRKSTLQSITDGGSNTILLGECAGREDVWRGRKMIPVNTDKTSPNCARAQGGAWATNDNPYLIGSRREWCTGAQSIPGKMKINNSNESGHFYYSFHDTGANFCMADGSARFIADDVALWVLASLTTRSGGEALSSTDY
jgi:prepilin-type processing-associated H-X9-DG protein